MKAKCRKCGDTVEVTKLKEYKTCKCGAIALDYGDPPYYYRVCGNLEDFDGEVEDAPEMLHSSPVFHEESPESFHQRMQQKNFVADKADRFWVEMAEHFEALAKLCKEKSREKDKDGR